MISLLGIPQAIICRTYPCLENSYNNEFWLYFSTIRFQVKYPIINEPNSPKMGHLLNRIHQIKPFNLFYLFIFFVYFIFGTPLALQYLSGKTRTSNTTGGGQ